VAIAARTVDVNIVVALGGLRGTRCSDMGKRSSSGYTV
jgi:hypothetical protein